MKKRGKPSFMGSNQCTYYFWFRTTMIFSRLKGFGPVPVLSGNVRAFHQSLNDDPSRNWIFDGLKPSRGGCQYRWLWVTSIDILSLLLVETIQMMYLSLWVVCVCHHRWWLNCQQDNTMDQCLDLFQSDIFRCWPNSNDTNESQIHFLSGKFRYCIWQLDTPIVSWLLDFHDMHDPIDHVNLYLRIFFSDVCIN